MYLSKRAALLLFALATTDTLVAGAAGEDTSSARFLRQRYDAATVKDTMMVDKEGSLQKEAKHDSLNKEDESYWNRLMQVTELSVAPSALPPTTRPPSAAPPVPTEAAPTAPATTEVATTEVATTEAATTEAATTEAATTEAATTEAATTEAAPTPPAPTPRPPSAAPEPVPTAAAPTGAPPTEAGTSEAAPSAVATVVPTAVPLGPEPTAEVPVDDNLVPVDDDALLPDQQTIAEVLTGDERFTTLVSLVSDAGLVSPLEGEGPLTVFAPTNEAFDGVDTSGLTEEDLKNILLYHVAEGRVPIDNDLSVTTLLEGSDLQITVSEEGTFVNDKTIVDDLASSNGIIYVVDGVLIPP